jgi:hypothetical protein
MTTTQTGWGLLIAGIGMMFTLLAGDVAHLEHWKDALDPAFMAGVMTHFGAIIAAFVGGKLLPGPSDARAELSAKVGV